MKTLHVKAAPGLRLPKEGAPRTYITETDVVPVVDSHYYRKAIADGDLVEVPVQAETPAKDALSDSDSDSDSDMV